MNATIICPDDTNGVPALARQAPLVLAPFLGRTVLEYALQALAAEGFRSVTIAGGTETDKISKAVSQGAPWGLEIRFQDFTNPAVASPSARVLHLDELPQLSGHELWKSYGHWHAAQIRLLSAAARERVGMREIAPGVFAHLRARIASGVTFTGPCWIGDHVRIQSGCVIGAETVIEDGSYLDSGAEVARSIVGPATYIGAFMELRNSFAWENRLLNLDTGAFTVLQDRILLSKVRPCPRWLAFWPSLICQFKKMRSWTVKSAYASPAIPSRRLTNEAACWRILF